MLENIYIMLAGGGNAENARQVVPEAVNQYPEVKTFGPLVPAYGIWARHVQGLKLLNVSFTLDSNDVRPALVCEDVKDVAVSGWKVPPTSGAESIIRLENVDKASISNNDVQGNAAAFVRIEGVQSNGVRVVNNKLNKTIKKVELSADVKPGTAYTLK